MKEVLDTLRRATIARGFDAPSVGSQAPIT
jgi:hypothetical protein